MVKHFSIKRSNDILEINYVLLNLSKHYRFQSLTSLGFYIFLLVVGLIIGFESGSFLIAGIITLFAAPYILTVLGKYIFYKKTNFKWRFDKSSQLIELHGRWKKIKTLKFDELEKIFYHKDHNYPDAPIYKLSFVLTNYKEFKIYKGKEKDCKSLGYTISKFLKKPLHNHFK